MYQCCRWAKLVHRGIEMIEVKFFNNNNKLRPKFLPREEGVFNQTDDNPKCPALPRRFKNYFAIISRRGSRRPIENVHSCHGFVALATPIMASRVTRDASASRSMLSLPAGRSGSTRNLVSELLSQTLISTSSLRSRPI